MIIYGLSAIVITVSGVVTAIRLRQKKQYELLKEHYDKESQKKNVASDTMVVKIIQEVEENKELSSKLNLQKRNDEVTTSVLTARRGRRFTPK